MASKFETKERPDVGYEECMTSTPLSLLDELRSKRSRLAAAHKRTIIKLDRQINLLESSGAEEIVKGAQEVLYSEE